MRLAPLRWLARYLSTFVLAFMLALTVWISAVITADPNEQHTFRPITIEQIGQDPDLLIVGEVPMQVHLTLKAPKSIWDKLNNNPDLAKAWIDLSGLGPGEHTVEVKIYVEASPVRYISVDPSEVRVALEPLVQREFSVEVIEHGELPLGYRKGTASLEPDRVEISGTESHMSQVAETRVVLDMSGATETISTTLPIEVLDKNGALISGLTLQPKTVIVNQPVSLLGGFKNVVVKVVTKGQVASGFRLTNVSVSPPTVTLFSDDPQLIYETPGYVETMPVDLTNLSDDVEMSVDLNLSKGITLVSKPNVLVQVSVAAIEGSLTLSVPVEIVGLSPELSAIISPETVDVIAAGPLNILDTLTPSSFRVILDLTSLPTGVYQRAPLVDLAPDQVRVQTILPETLEVKIELAPTPTQSSIPPSRLVATPTPLILLTATTTSHP